MISPIIPTHDADTIGLELGIFIARQSRHYRVSREAVIAAIREALPSQPSTPSQAPAASTSTPAPVDVQAEGDDASLSADPIPEAPKPLPAAIGHDQQPAESKTSDQGALSSEPGGMQDECAIHPATPSKPKRIKRPAVAEALQKVVEAQKAAIAPKAPTQPKPKPAGKPAPRVTTVQRVRDLHAEHPDWSHRQFCAALPDANPQTISVELSRIRAAQRVVEDAETQRRLIAEARDRENAPAAERGDKRTLTDRVRALHAQHPNWTARLIAIELGANSNSVSALLAGIRNPKAVPAPAKPEFTGRRQMVEHYGAIAKRLGKSS